MGWFAGKRATLFSVQSRIPSSHCLSQLIFDTAVSRVAGHERCWGWLSGEEVNDPCFSAREIRRLSTFRNRFFVACFEFHELYPKLNEPTGR